jgi:hypothetical protein
MVTAFYHHGKTMEQLILTQGVYFRSGTRVRISAPIQQAKAMQHSLPRQGSTGLTAAAIKNRTKPNINRMRDSMALFYSLWFIVFREVFQQVGQSLDVFDIMYVPFFGYVVFHPQSLRSREASRNRICDEL